MSTTATEFNPHTKLLLSNEARGSTYVNEGWLPPEAECPELAHLHAEHVRLVGVMNEALAKVGTLRRETESAESRRGEAVREAILAGTDPAKVKVTVPDAATLHGAARDFETSVEALTIFVKRALAEIEELAPTIEANVADRLRAADAKRAEARRLLAEADRLAASPARMRSWLDRYVTVTDEFSKETRKRSVLGPIAFSDTDLPLPVPVPDLFSELAGLGPANGTVVVADEPTDEEREAWNAD